jgi:tetratricopeptide (TPR) repeat protein
MGEFLCGAAALEIRNLSKAIKCFNEVLDASRQTGEPFLKDEAEYYLSLSYIRNQDYDEALALLNTIENDPAHKYSEKVDDKLIRQVERLREK